MHQINDPSPLTELEHAQLAAYQERAQRIQDDAIAQYDLFTGNNQVGCISRTSRSPWKMLAQVDNLAAFTKSAYEGNEHNLTKVHGHISGDIEHIMSFFYSETTDELCEWSQYMHYQLAGGGVLCNVQTVSTGSSKSYLGVKYVISQAQKGIAGRCFLEYMAYVKDGKNRTLGVRIVTPVDWDSSSEELSKYSDVNVLESQTVYIFRSMPNRPTETEVFAIGDPEFCGVDSTTSSYRWQLEKLRNISVYIESRQICRRGILNRSDWIPDRARSACNVCARKFSTTRHRHHCRMCGEVVCRKCIVLRHVSGKSQKHRIRPLKTKFCVACVAMLRINNPQQRKKSVTTPRFTQSLMGVSSGRFNRSGLSSSTSENHTESLIRSRKSDTPLENKSGAFEQFLDESDKTGPNARRLSLSRLRVMREELLANQRQQEAVQATELWLQSYDQQSSSESLRPEQRRKESFAANESVQKDAEQSIDTQADHRKHVGHGNRTLDQCIAEQEVLLQRLVSALHSHHISNEISTTMRPQQYIVSPMAKLPSSYINNTADFSSDPSYSSDDDIGFYEL
uniref:Uncharacterized protein AlNc14C179G8177 n=1 Tax=Albugo laibachii Nc14 TaxID=890382 RepID=F0WEK9_9STRA|nr:conserved hypothetical protein [Albugo laibachii Nc14]CCA23073.1 conserved hypothetical protein [Albugo laibachii Nc14]|eukprot:CCA23073.1 conserved hypothetical protein [Albugo laibachii Nc14]